MTISMPGRRAASTTPENGGAKPWPPHAAETEPKVRAATSNDGGGEPLAATLALLPPEERFLRESLAVLTEREREVVLAICAGGTNDAIAERLCIALPTLRTHLMRLNQKLHGTSKGDVVRHAATVVIEGYRQGRIARLGSEAGAAV